MFTDPLGNKYSSYYEYVNSPDLNDYLIHVMILNGERTPQNEREKELKKMYVNMRANVQDDSSFDSNVYFKNEIIYTEKDAFEELKKHHLFYIQSGENVNAFGYFDPDTGCFYLSKGSTIEKLNCEFTPSGSIGQQRSALLRQSAFERPDCYQLIVDVKFSTADIASNFVIGRFSNMQWRDNNGIYLEDVYPEYFTQKTYYLVSEPLLHIKEDFSPTRKCDAFGYFILDDKKFKLLKGSLLSLDVTPSFKYTTSDIQRNIFLELNCVKEDGGYRLMNDYICSSPTQASNYVVGDITDGGTIWREEHGYDLYTIFQLEL